MKKIFFSSLVLPLSFLGLMKLQEPAPPKPTQSDAAALELLKKIDGVMFNYPDAGVHTISLSMKLGGNPFIPPDMKDAKLIYYWRQEPWAEAVDIQGLPADKEAMKPMMLKGALPAMRKFALHAFSELPPHGVVTTEKDGELTKLQFAPHATEKNFMAATFWVDANYKLIKGQAADANGVEKKFEVTLIPQGSKFLISEMKFNEDQKAVFAYGKSGDLPVINTMTPMGSGSVFSFDVELNPKLDASIFEAKTEKKEEKKPEAKPNEGKKE